MVGRKGGVIGCRGCSRTINVQNSRQGMQNNRNRKLHPAAAKIQKPEWLIGRPCRWSLAIIGYD